MAVRIIGKKGFDMAMLLIVVIIVVIGIVSLILVYSISGDPFKETAIRLANETEERANVSFGNIKLDSLVYSGRPYDECGNSRGFSTQDTRYGDVSLAGMTEHPEYYECTGYDCCRGFVYEHILDMGKEYKDIFFHVDYYIQNEFEVDSIAKGCTAGACCEFGSSYVSTDGDIVYCEYSDPFIFLFYYSATGKEADWHKLYHTRYWSTGKQELILPIGDRFRFVKIISLNAYLDYANGEIIPWNYPGNRVIDVCTQYYPDKEGYNYLYNPDGDEIILLDPLVAGTGYILNMSTDGARWQR